MKKTIKTAVAMFLAVIIASGSMVAFAATPSDIEWDFDWKPEKVVHSYAGKLAVGETVTLDPKGDDNVYCTLEIEKDGYYKFSSTYYSTDYFRIAERFENGVCYGSRGCIKVGEICADEFYYLEAGSYIVGTEFFAQMAEQVTVRYVGDVVDYSFSEENLDSLIFSKNLYIIDDEDGNEQYRFDPFSRVTIEFSSGEKLPLDYAWPTIYTDEELKEGEYEVEIGFDSFPYREKKTINVIDVAKLISKVEITNIEKYTVLKKFYDRSVDYPSVEGETLTVTYTDGTTETITDFDGNDELEKYGLNVRSEYDTLRYGVEAFHVYVANVPFIEEKCTVELAGDKENVDRYINNNLEAFEFGFTFTEFYYKQMLRNDSGNIFDSFREFVFETASIWLDSFARIMDNTARMFDYAA